MAVILEGNEKVVAKAHADLEGDTIIGTADFEELQIKTQILVRITVELSGDPAKLIPGLHAVHIHEKGTCEGGFKCAGGHFDPGPAGNTDPDVNHPFHSGDLPNIEIDKEGRGRLQCITTRVTLSEGPLCILSGEGTSLKDSGTSLMIHGNPDPYRGGDHGSGISGGPRVACGVIWKA